MTEGYADRTDPGLTVRFPLLDRPGEALLVWTTTPWTLTSNVAAAVGPGLRYVKVRQGDSIFWLGRGTVQQALVGPFEILDDRAGSELVGWRYRGPFDELPAVRAGFAAGGAAGAPYEHVVVGWDPTSTSSWRGTRSARTRGRGSSISRRAAGRRTSRSASRSGCRCWRRSTRAGRSSRGSAS